MFYNPSMNKFKRIFIPFTAITLLVLGFGLIGSTLLLPHRQTPIKQLIPAPSSDVTLKPEVTIAAWIWQYPSTLNAKITPLLDFATKEGLNTIYISVDEYIDLYELPDSADKTSKLSFYNTALRNIIEQASTRSISVHAVAGNPSYSYDSHEYIPPLLLKHVYEFNQNNPSTTFAGIQFDIEFYDEERFFDDPKAYTQSYLKLVNTLTKQNLTLSQEFSQNLSLGFVIPFWFDQEVNDYFDQPILPEIISSLSTLNNPYLVIMSYRNQVEDVLRISKDELEQTQNTPVSIIIAQELVENKDQKITHYGKNKDQIKTTLNQIIESAKTYPSFQGISIHDLEALMDTR